MFEHLHSGKKLLDVVGNEVFDSDIAQSSRLIVGELNESGENRGNLEAGELDGVSLRVSNANRQVQGQTGDVGERVSRVHSQWHQYREDLLAEEIIEALAVRLAQVTPGLNVDVLGIECRLDEVMKRSGMALLQLVSHRRNVIQYLLG